MAEGFKDVAHMGLATGMVIGGAAGAFSRGVARAQAWQDACDANARRDDEVAGFNQMVAAFRAERARADREKARADVLEKRLADLALENARLMMKR